MCLRGRKGGAFNFPQNLPDIPVRRSLPPAEVQAVASRFANEAPPAAPPADGGVGLSRGWSCRSRRSRVAGLVLSRLRGVHLDGARRRRLAGLLRHDRRIPCEFLPTLAAPPGLPDFMEEHGGASFYAQSSFLWDF
ncbi:unnamed protein product [Spirodela intermedia]|uniref:Uncharacterized protein n=1 Tax=Spirodela intermedia TaxID=51605 RepID=A0A7I8IMC5_SPIIN|nr:unnamed protein product [Spirodela intermedia]CAA6658690.1 unnamed protein product [Spirodela intermedia]